MKTASTQNFAGFVFKNFETRSNDILDFSRDLQELGENVEQQKTEVEPLPKETVDYAIRFLKTQGKDDGRAIRFELQNNGKTTVSLVEQGGEEYITIMNNNENKFYSSDLNGKIIIPKNILNYKGTIHADKIEKYKKEGQQYINDVFNNLQNQY